MPQKPAKSNSKTPVDPKKERKAPKDLEVGGSKVKGGGRKAYSIGGSSIRSPLQ